MLNCIHLVTDTQDGFSSSFDFGELPHLDSLSVTFFIPIYVSPSPPPPTYSPFLPSLVEVKVGRGMMGNVAAEDIDPLKLLQNLFCHLLNFLYLLQEEVDHLSKTRKYLSN